YFIQADDGIRDFHVTGVQTCALPIYFTNHLLRISEEVMNRQGLDFEMLKPLIIEQISKSLQMGAKAAQTGPAVRGDLSTLDLHYHFLNYNEQVAEIYKLISQDIIDTN